MGEGAFLEKLDAWFAFPAKDAVRLSPSGSCMLRLLVWYASLVDIDRSLPMLVRVADVNWHKREPAQKIVSAVAWLLRTRGDLRYDVPVDTIYRDWAGESSEAAKLKDAGERQDLRQASDASMQEAMLKLSHTLSDTLTRMLGQERPKVESTSGVPKPALQRPKD